MKCRRKFLRFFPKGFADEKYWHWERGYKWRAHERWLELLSKGSSSLGKEQIPRHRSQRRADDASRQNSRVGSYETFSSVLPFCANDLGAWVNTSAAKPRRSKWTCTFHCSGDAYVAIDAQRR